MEKSIAKIEKRLDGIQNDISSLRKLLEAFILDTHKRFVEIDERFKQMDRRFDILEEKFAKLQSDMVDIRYVVDNDVVYKDKLILAAS